MPEMPRTRRFSLSAGLLALMFFITLFLLYEAARAADSQLALLMNADRGAAFTAVMVAASLYGRDYFWPGVVAVMLIFGSKRTKVDAIELAILFVAGILTGEVLKDLINKPRPFEILLNIITATIHENTTPHFPRVVADCYYRGDICALEIQQEKHRNRAGT